MHALVDRLSLQLVQPRPDRLHLRPEQLRDDEVDDLILARGLLALQVARQILQFGHGQGGQNNRQIDPKYSLTDKLWAYLQGYAAKHKAAGNGFGFGLVYPDSVARTLSARYYKDGSEILVHQGEGRNPRRLTPRECARLMGFDRPGSNKPFVIPVSDTQAYKQFGNAVAAPVAVAIAETMAPWLSNIVALKPAKRRTAGR